MAQPPADVLEFLASIGATKTGHHAGRSLNDHLLATWQLLTEWQADQSVCLAGLCHSVYGTDAFDTACLGPKDRHVVRSHIGKDGEQIAYLFGAMDREAFLADPSSLQIFDRFADALLSITMTERTAICDILLANELDLVIAKKGNDRPEKVLKKVGPVFEKIGPFLSAQAKSAYQTLSNQR
ncbi:MAG: DUF6817 domain-containing protein [Salaquimonas sp.]